MTKKRGRIRFEMEELSEITDNLVIINRDFYTIPINKHQSSKRFAIPKDLVNSLQLKAGDACYYIKYEDGFYISFKTQPTGIPIKQIKKRNLVRAGEYNTLYLVVPVTVIRKTYPEMTHVQIIHIKGFQEYEWQFKPLFIDSILENN